MNTSFLYTLWICLVVVSPCILGGMTVGFSSIAIPELNLNMDAISWFSCLFTVGAPFGALNTGYLLNKFGRKPALVCSVIPGMIGWLLIATCEKALWRLYLGRFLTGFSSGCSYFPGQIYIAEFMDLDPKLIPYRSSFTNIVPTGTAFGFFLVMLFGVFFSYKSVALFAFILSICVVSYISVFIPESPMWLYHKGRYGDAEWSQKRLNIPTSLENFPSPIVNKDDNTCIFEKLKRKDVYTPLFITCICVPLVQLCGPPILTSYLINLLDPVKLFSLRDAYKLGVISALFLFISSAAVVATVPFTGIRKVVIGSSIGMMVAMLTYGIADYFNNSDYASFAHWVSVVAVCLAEFCYGFGFITIPRAVLGEIFPTDASSLSAIPAVLMYIVESTVIKLHPYLAVSMKGFVYIIYAFFSALQALFLFYFLPETVGKKVIQINYDFIAE